MSDTEVKRKVGWALRELDALYSPVTLDVRAENAYGVAVRLFELIAQMIPEDEDRKRLMAAWFKSVRDSDFRKFRRMLKRYDRSKNQTA